MVKYLDRTQTAPEAPSYVRSQPAPAPQLGAYHAVIQQWLEADQTAPRKQRHTSRRIWQRLRDEYGATVSESTVRHYVAQLRRRLHPEDVPVFLDLVFDPGEAAQVDWGEAKIVLDGHEWTAQIFCMRLAHSGAAFVQVFPHQRLEAFLAAHVAAFDFFGGIPQHLIYDNLTTAVQRILHGRGRQLNARFAEFVAHYVYLPLFATPASGWEKGLVEGLVGYARRTFMVPVPTAPDWNTLNARLRAQCLQERDRVLPRRHGDTIGILWDRERTAFLPLPPQAFQPATWWTVRVSSQSLVRHHRAVYSVPTSYVGQSLRLAAFWDHVELWTLTERVASHPLGQPDELQLQLDHYLDALRHKPGAVRNARVVRDLGPVVRSYQQAFLAVHPEAYGAFVDILFLFRRFPATQILDAQPAALTAGCFDAEALSQRLSHPAAGNPADAPQVAQNPQGPRVAQPHPRLYDQLTQEALLS